MIEYKKINESDLNIYDEVKQRFLVKSKYILERINNGLGGVILKEIPVEKEYIKDFGSDRAMKLKERFDVSNWAFYIAFDNGKAIGAVSIASKTDNVYMLENRDDLAVLWDIRVDENYKHQGIGQKLFDIAVNWAKDREFKQLKIECQNNNVPACNFYHKQGAILSKMNEYAYYKNEELKNEIQFIWYLDL